MKKIIKQLMAISLVLGAVLFVPAIVSYAADGTIAFSDPTGKVGEEITIKVKMEAGGAAIGDGQATISYDSSKLEFISGTNATNENGTVQLSASGTGTETELNFELKFKALADKKKVIKDRDLEALVGAVPVSGEERYTLDRFVINSGNTITSTAVIRMKKGEETLERAAVSDGPINAAFRAINKIVGKEVELADYTLRSMTDGEDAQAESIVKISIDGSEIVTGRGVSTDVIEASIKAYINGINKYFID